MPGQKLRKRVRRRYEDGMTLIPEETPIQSSSSSVSAANDSSHNLLPSESSLVSSTLGRFWETFGSGSESEKPVAKSMESDKEVGQETAAATSSIVSLSSIFSFTSNSFLFQKPHETSFTFLRVWAQKLLDCMRSREADPDIGKPCSRCNDPAAIYRCFDCFSPPILCLTCTFSVHRWSPFHQIESWTGSYFQRTTLGELGHIMELGHRGLPCPVASKTTHKITVIHSTGIQEANIRYCECVDEKSGARIDNPIQLWNASLWPASYLRVRTAFSLHTLRNFHQLTLQAKTTAYDYISTLRRLTNNSFFRDVKV